MMQVLWGARKEHSGEAQGVDKSKSAVVPTDLLLQVFRCELPICRWVLVQWKRKSCALQWMYFRGDPCETISFSLHEFSLMKMRLMPKLWIWSRLNACLSYQRTERCHSRENKYKWQHSVSAVHLGFTNMLKALLFFFNLLSYITPRKQNSWRMLTGFHLCKDTCHSKGEEQIRNFQVKKCKMILWANITSFSPTVRIFFSHSSRRECRAKLDQNVLI